MGIELRPEKQKDSGVDKKKSFGGVAIVPQAPGGLKCHICD